MFFVAVEDFWLNDLFPVYHPVRLFLHVAASTDAGTLPSSSQTISAVGRDAIPVGTETNRSMDVTVGTSQVTQNDTFPGESELLARFLSAPLAAQTIPAANWTLAFAGSRASAPGFADVNWTIGVWRPSTGAVVGLIVDQDPSADVSIIATAGVEVALSKTFSGASVVVQDGDILILELGTGGSTTVNLSVYYDGTTQGSTTSNAANLLAPNLIFSTPTTTSIRLLSLLGVGV
jgi:hypothetical protein